MRTILESLRDPKQRCIHCAKPLARHAKFCTWCGKENPNFDEVELVQQRGMTLHEARAYYCFNEHRVLWEEALHDPKLFEEQPYCPFCGIRFVPS